MPKKVTAEPLRYQHFKGEPNVRRSTPGPRVTALVSLAVTLVLALSRLAEATTINANSASQSDVAAAIASATDGDIVIIPGGISTWTRTLSVKKAIELRGAGIGSTIIKDNVQNAPLITVNLVAGRLTRLTGIEFQNGGRQSTAIGGTIRVEGSNTNGSQFRFDHNAWNRVNGTLLCDTVIGVIDHNQFTQNVTAGTVWIYGSRWDGRSYGDGSWAAPTGFGSSQFLFIEDNTWQNVTGAVMAMTDAYGGARFVVRHNQINDCSIANHGTESTTRPRGCRAMEIYGNTFRGTNINRFIGGARSGTAVIHDNNITGYLGNSVTYSLSNYRGNTPFEPWSGADGVNAWDVNAPNPFFTGTAASNSSGRTVSVSGNPNWTVNQWIGYTIRRTSNLCGSSSVIFALIISNTANTLTYADSVYGNFLTFCAGDSLEIRRVEHALDQPGRAGGSLITGDTPVRPRGWNDQVTEPIYSWNNTPAVTIEALPNIRPNVHFFNNTALPGYTPYVYPHPLVNGGTLSLLPSPPATRTSFRKPWGKKQEKTKELKRKPGKKAKQNQANEMPESQEKLDN